MREVINPYREIESSITPKKFEIFCKETLKAYALQENLRDFTITDNKIIESDDGTYQIDVYAEFTALGTKNKVLVECKRYSNPIKRELVVILNDKLRSIGAQKGILISTIGFQSGATEYALKHGIALWQICDEYIRQYSESSNRPHDYEFIFGNLVQSYLPKYFVVEWDLKYDFPGKDVYPTQDMRIEAREKARKELLCLKNQQQ